MNARTLTLTGLFAAVAVCGPLAAPAFARQPEVHTSLFSRTALDGYDPVAYFAAGRPEKGDKRFAIVWKGAEFRFATAERLAQFRANPAAYAPQFGGYCAWAVSQGYTAKGDPRFWKIVGGKLYLNYDAQIQARWETDIGGHIARAERNWPQVLD